MYYNEGYERGLVEGVRGGFEEGYIMGREEGTLLGEELGRLAANILLIKKKSSENGNNVNVRLERLWKEIFSYPMNNEENGEKANMIHRIRSANLELCKKTGLRHLLVVENEGVSSANNKFDF